MSLVVRWVSSCCPRLLQLSVSIFFFYISSGRNFPQYKFLWRINLIRNREILKNKGRNNISLMNSNVACTQILLSQCRTSSPAFLGKRRFFGMRVGLTLERLKTMTHFLPRNGKCHLRTLSDVEIFKDPWKRRHSFEQRIRLFRKGHYPMLLTDPARKINHWAKWVDVFKLGFSCQREEVFNRFQESLLWRAFLAWENYWSSRFQLVDGRPKSCTHKKELLLMEKIQCD